MKGHYAMFVFPIRLTKFTGDYSDEFNNHITTKTPLDVIFYGSNNVINVSTDNKNIILSVTMYNNGTLILGSNVACNMFNNLKIKIADDALVKIGNNTAFINGCKILADKQSVITIGNDCLFSTNTLISCSTAISAANGTSNTVFVADHIWSGWGTTLIQGCNLGCCCIVGAKSLIDNKFPPNSLIAGDPAKIIRSNVTWHRNNMEYDINAVPAEYRTISNT